MNIGYMIFKRMQRLQGGTSKVNPDPEEGQTMRALPLGFVGGGRESTMFPRREPPLPRMNTWADYFAMLMQQMKQDELERMKDIDPDMVWNPPTERPPDEGKGRQRLQRGVSTVSDEEYEQALNDDFERNLRKRRFKPKKGPQFDPRDVPVFYDIDSGQKIFDPKYSSSEDAMYAQGGTGDVRYTPVDPTKDYPYSTDYEFIHRKVPDVTLDDEQGHDSTEGPTVIPPGLNFKGEKMSPLEEARESTFSTIGLKGLDNRQPDREWEVPTTWEDMPPAVMEYVHNLPQDQWPPWVLDAIENNARDLLEQGIHPLTGYKVDDPRNTPDPTPAPETYAQGTSSVNQGLYFFRNQLRKKKI